MIEGKKKRCHGLRRNMLNVYCTPVLLGETVSNTITKKMKM